MSRKTLCQLCCSPVSMLSVNCMNCSLPAHLQCFAKLCPPSRLLPIVVICPSCAIPLNWQELAQQCKRAVISNNPRPRLLGSEIKTDQSNSLPSSQDDALQILLRLIDANDAHLPTKHTISEVQPFRKTHLMLYDLETTGLIRKGIMPDIVEMSVFHPETGATFSTLVNSGVPIPRYVRNVHNISNSMLAGAPRFDEAYRSFLEWLCRFGDAQKSTFLLVAHNGTQFDERVLRHHVQQANSTLPDRVVFGDSLRFFRAAMPRSCYQGNYNLNELCQLFSIFIPHTRHRADIDNYILWDALCCLTSSLTHLPVFVVVTQFFEKGEVNLGTITAHRLKLAFPAHSQLFTESRKTRRT
eukprot:NODE_2393_length_1189_cov_14.387006_g2279_i0.p1 GENE.NODE_2393_length_1189_cov_14.387006_g2279_i0~~NODE_2393_length_1189_cov_14.387006_g2279_i0.p1  ORF type:complete len:355 (-),score=40.83 NODE_2393_length_1189_cov_14.387006_g2279_i0:113-1177(-)